MKSGVQEEGQVGFINLEMINGEMVFIAMGLYKIILEGSFLQESSQDWVLGIPAARDQEYEEPYEAKDTEKVHSLR